MPMLLLRVLPLLRVLHQQPLPLQPMHKLQRLTQRLQRQTLRLLKPTQRQRKPLLRLHKRLQRQLKLLLN
jgi:hypothetical protein